MNFNKIISLLLIALCYFVAPAFTRSYKPHQQQQAVDADAQESNYERGKRDHHQGITGPVHTYVKTDKHANFKWGVRHHVGHHYAGRR